MNIDSSVNQDIEARVTTLVKNQLNSSDKVETLDAFVFEQSGKLDCYQRIVSPDSSCEIASSSGSKQIFLIANSKYEREEWAKIRNLSTLKDIYVELETERHDSPIMTSLLNVTAGEQVNISFLPLRSEVRLNSIRCDFSNEAYYNEILTDVKIYLTNVNANCSLVADEQSSSSRFINTSMLDTGHLSLFEEQDIVMQSIDIDIGNVTTKIQRSLFCYANQPIEESVGSPMTKLVIEGKIGGHIYYYPIKINPQGGGIARGCRYNFDIVLTRTGVTDPDGELNEKDIEINMEVEEWKEKNGYIVSF